MHAHRLKLLTLGAIAVLLVIVVVLGVAYFALRQPATSAVTAASGATTALRAALQPADLVAPTAEYRAYAVQSASDLTRATAALDAAIRSGDAAAARTHAANALAAFSHLAPILHLFSRDANPLSTGPAALPALTKALAAPAAAADLAGLADVAARSAINLGSAIEATTAAPHEIVAGTGAVVADLAKGFDDPVVAANRIAGVSKVVELFRPLTLRADEALSARLDDDLSAVEGALGTSRAPDSAALRPHLAKLSADMTDLLSALGLNVSP